MPVARWRAVDAGCDLIIAHGLEAGGHGSSAAHGTMAPWNSGCSCARCRQMQSNAARGRRKAQERLPTEMHQRLLDAIYAGQSFRRVLRDLGLTSTKSGE